MIPPRRLLNFLVNYLLKKLFPATSKDKQGGFKFEVQQLMVAWCSASSPRIILHAAIPPAFFAVGGSVVLSHIALIDPARSIVQAGVDLPTVKRISGHKNLHTVERYSHRNGAYIEAAMDKLAERYRKAS